METAFSKLVLQRLHWIVPSFLTLVLIISSFYIWSYFLYENQLRQRELINIAGENAKAEVTEKIHEYDHAMRRMATRLAYLGIHDEKLLEIDSKSYLAHLKGLKRIGLVDRHLQVIWSYPVEIRDQVKSFNQRTDSKRKAAFDDAFEGKDLALSAMINLQSGGNGFILPVRITTSKGDLGFVYATIESSAFFSQIAAFRDFQVRITDGSQLVYGELDSTDHSEWANKKKIPFGSRNLQIELKPKMRIISDSNRYFPSFILALSLTISILIGLSLGFAMFSHQQRRKLTASQARIDFVTEGTNQGFFEHDLISQDLYMSEICKRLIGISSSEDVRIESWAQRIHPEDRARVQKSRSDYLAKIQPRYEIEYRMLNPATSEVRWLHAKGHASWSNSGQPIKLAGSVTDITDRKKAEKIIEDLNRFNEAIFENAPNSISVFEADGPCIKINQAALRLTGSRREEVLGVNFRELTSWRDSGLLSKANECLLTDQPTVFSGSMVTISGLQVYLHGTFVPLTISDKKVLLFHSTDITELKKAHATAQLYMSVLDQSAAVYFTDPEGEISYFNSISCNLSGYTTEEMVGKSPRILKSDWHSKEFFQQMWKTIGSGQSWQGEICNRKKTGELYWVNATIIPQVKSDGGIEQYISVQYDITKEKNAELQLLNSAKMSSLGVMASGIAHEINTPLAIIDGNIHLLQKILEKGPIDIEKAHKFAHSIVKTTARIAKIISGLRAFARDGAQDPFSNVLVSKLIQAVLELCTTKFSNNNVAMDVTSIAPDLEIWCQEIQISQVLLNLLHNSYDAIAGTENAFIKIEAYQMNSEFVEIIVTDSGHGISPEIATKIMQPFFTTKDIGKGTGLGLSISSGIVKSHDGELFLDQNAKNTRFVIRLPKKPLLEKKLA